MSISNSFTESSVAGSVGGVVCVDVGEDDEDDDVGMDDAAASGDANTT